MGYPYQFKINVVECGPFEIATDHAIVPVKVKVEFEGPVSDPKERSAILEAGLKTIIAKIAEWNMTRGAKAGEGE